MIQKMNKYAFLIYHREYEEFLSTLQDLGVVHIQQTANPRDAEELRLLQEERVAINTQIKSLGAWLAEDAPKPTLLSISEEEGRRVQGELDRAIIERGVLSDRITALRQTIDEQSIWGDFSPSDVQRLSDNGYTLALYTTGMSTYTDRYVEEYETHSIGRVGATVYFVRLERAGDTPCPDAERHPIPQKSLSELKAELSELEATREKHDADLRVHAVDRRDHLEALDRILANRYSFGAARLQGRPEAEDKLIFLEGWIPTIDAPEMENELAKTGYYFRPSEIKAEDSVPIKLKNNSFSRLFEPITRMFSLPNYSEIDQTAFFAPFFMLFFGLCMGDAGYGLLILLVGTFLRIKAKPKADTSSFVLMQWLGGVAFLVGIATGSLFGVTLPYAQSKDYIFYQDNMMMMSVIIGLLQIFFAKGVAAYKIKVQRGMKYALAPFAWILLIIALLAWFMLPMLKIELSETTRYIFYGVIGLSALIAFFYNTPGANPFVNFGSALWTAYNNASGLLGDTLSYIRLFAIGLTGAILGGVFNALAIDQTEGLPPLVRFPTMLLVLLFGHGLNFGLAVIGALVHPLRLTFVEYYKNSEFEGGGKSYTPFEKK